ncbi:MAG: helix-turn-helix transcriptional regulator [Clostridia bacterium]|nr:helix-turn-helix transcriptional regulator [Clostridia bacterium]
MLYNGDNPVIRIIGVRHLKWKEERPRVAPRECSSLAFRISGSGRIECGGKEHFINTNDIVYLPQNLGYDAEYTDTEMIAIHFVTARDDTEIEVYSFENGEQIYKLFLDALSLWEKKEPAHTVYTMSALYAILGEILERQTKAKLPAHFLRAVAFINQNYKRNISIDAVCAEAGISATVFRRLFREHYGKTPVEYIVTMRLEHAADLISGGTLVEIAAYESGFNDPKYFARVVKKRMGCTPRELKNYGK